MRRDARVDGNHKEHFDLARQLGGVVIDTRSVGHGAPDGFVYVPRQRRWLAVENKTARGRLTAQQAPLHVQAPIEIWRVREDVYRAFGVRIGGVR